MGLSVTFRGVEVDGGYQLVFERQGTLYVLTARRGNARVFRLDTLVRFLRARGVLAVELVLQPGSSADDVETDAGDEPR